MTEKKYKRSMKAAYINPHKRTNSSLRIGRTFILSDVCATLQAIAGHSTIDMTMNRYVHAQPEKIKDAGKRMHNLLAG